MDANLINADNYPIGDDKIIRLLPVEKVKKLHKGTKLFSVGGKEVTVGVDDLDLETNVFQRSKYGELIDMPVIKGTLVHVSGKTKNRPYVEEKEKSHGKPEKSEKKHRKKS